MIRQPTFWGDRPKRCSQCDKWYSKDTGMRCGVLHYDECCHYGQTQATDKEIVEERARRRVELDMGAVC